MAILSRFRFRNKPGSCAVHVTDAAQNDYVQMADFGLFDSARTIGGAFSLFAKISEPKFCDCSAISLTVYSTTRSQVEKLTIHSRSAKVRFQRSCGGSVLECRWELLAGWACSCDSSMPRLPETGFCASERLLPVAEPPVRTGSPHTAARLRSRGGGPWRSATDASAYSVEG